MEETVKKKRSIWWTEMLFAAICAAIVTCGRSIYNYNTVLDAYYRLPEYGAIFLFVFLPLIFVFAAIGAGVKKAAAAAKKISAEKTDEEDGSDTDKKITEYRRSGIYRFLPLITSLLVICSGAR